MAEKENKSWAEMPPRMPERAVESRRRAGQQGEATKLGIGPGRILPLVVARARPVNQSMEDSPLKLGN